MTKPDASQQRLFEDSERPPPLVLPAAPRRELAELARELPTHVRLGTMSWSYAGWRGIVYAPDTDAKKLARGGLAAYAQHPLLTAVEIDRTYYEPVPVPALRAYAGQVPPSFRFVVKAHEACVVERFPLHARYGKRRGEPNPLYLDATYASESVVRPAVDTLGEQLGAIVFQFPPEASGVFLTGTSTANLCAMLIARDRALGVQVRADGVRDPGVAAYASRGVHACIVRAMDMTGLGTNRLRLIETDADHRVSLPALKAAIAADRANGIKPFLIVGSAGTVDVGAVDDLDALADVAAAEGATFHVDGALGALGVLSPAIAPRLKGIERADSLALDFHKLGQVPYDAGFLLCRDPEAHKRSFSYGEAPYLRHAERGLAGGEWWPCDYGPDLSRGFRALKVWLTLRTYGLDAIGAVVAQTCALAEELARQVKAHAELELMAPVGFNIVCFGYRGGDNAAIAADLQEEGRVAPSTTTLSGRTAIRAAIINHRTGLDDIAALVDGVLARGRAQAERR